MIVAEHAGNEDEGVDVPGLIKESGFGEECVGFVSQLLKIKYGEYKRELMKKELYQGGTHLANFNWKIKV